MAMDGVRVGRLALRKGEAGTAEQRIEIDWIFDTIAQACSSW